MGIFEEWELSMKLFNAKVKSPVEVWDAGVAHNAGVTSEAREQLLEWAHLSPELHSVLSADLLIYRFAMSVFKQQTTESLGTVWD